MTEIRGGDEARRHLDGLSERYTGKSHERAVRSKRVILVIAPERQRAGLRG
ncbi:MAG TPA: hypothetical protein VNF07_06230 [Acidimicrobiales bacterium]|nr:hypothetical protein [Acidimicrobiales bacterium]